MRLTRSLWAAQASLRTKATPTVATIDTKQLAEQLKPRGRAKQRTEIVSSELCDQAIELLRSQNALPAPDTYDIVDLNPGISIWSQALQRASNPRRHILLEPEKQQYYGPQIDPLMTDPKSKYRLIEKDRLYNIDNVHESLSPKFVKARSSKSDARQQINPHLVIIANLSGKRISVNYDYDKWFLYNFSRAIRNIPERDWQITELGLPRLLLWLPDHTVNKLLPRGIQIRSGFNRALEAQYDIRQIVGRVPGNDQVVRPWYGADIENFRKVRHRQQQAGLVPPPGRSQPEPQPYSAALEPVPDNFEALKSLQSKPPLINEFLDSWKETAEHYPDWIDRYIQNYYVTISLRKLKLPANRLHRLKQDNFAILPHKDAGNHCLSEMQVKFKKLWGRVKTRHKHYLNSDALARRRVALEEELLDIRKAHPADKTPYEARLAEVRPEFEEIKTTWAKMFKDDRSSYLKAVDDYRAVLHGILHWNVRPYEPLLSHTEDFFPPKVPLALLDLTPREDYLQRINSPERQICFEYVNASIDMSFSPTMETLIERLIGPKGTDQYNEFLAKLPTLTDPLSQGYHDLSDVRARAIPIDHLIELAVAYEAWPYRRDTVDLLDKLKPVRLYSKY